MNEFDNRDHTIKPLAKSLVKIINESIYKEEATKANRLVILDLLEGDYRLLTCSHLKNLPP